MTILNRRSVIALALTAATLVGCSSSPVPIDTYYRLEQGAAIAPRAGGPLKGLAEVMPLRGEGVVNGRAILYRSAPSELRQYSYHFWADTPASMLQRDLIDALRSAQAFETIALPEMRMNRDYEVMGALRKLEHDVSGSNPRAIIELELAVRKTRGSQPLLLKVYKAEVPAAADGVSAAIPGFSTALDQIFTQFVADLAQIEN